MEKCFVCNKEFETIKGLAIHIVQFHKIKITEYYDMYCRKNKFDGICKMCGKRTRFNNLRDGYVMYCSEKCSSNDVDIRKKTIDTNIEKYGTKTPAENKIILNKIKQTTLKNYGVENSFQSDHIKEKIKYCKKNKYNNENYNNRDQAEKTSLDKYSEKHFTNRKLAKQTTLKNYGVENPFQSDYIKEKIKQTNLEKYGVEWITLTDKNIKARLKAQYSKSHEKLFNILKQINSSFKKEEKVAQYIVDIINYDKKLIIECYGDYWHCNPNKYDEDYYHPQLKKTAKEKWNDDKIRKQNLETMGYTVLEFWNSDINTAFDIVLDKILKSMEGIYATLDNG